MTEAKFALTDYPQDTEGDFKLEAPLRLELRILGYKAKVIAL